MVMSKLLFGLLLAGAAAPALAAGGPHDRRHNDDNNSSQQQAQPARSNEQARPQVERQDRGDRQRPQFNGGERPQFTGQRPQFNAGERPQFNAQRPQWNGGERPQFTGQRPQGNVDVQRYRPAFRDNPYSQQAPDTVRNWRPREQTQTGGYYQQRQVRTNDNGYVRNDQWRRDGSRSGVTQTFRYDGHRDSRVRWNHDWRNDRRYDWRDRRRHNSSLFHIGLYVDPFGWGYQNYSIGYDLAPNYYQQNYWIDPGMYGLPYPPPGMQWVRYYNDALLIDMYSGQVVDAIQGFFW